MSKDSCEICLFWKPIPEFDWPSTGKCRKDATVIKDKDSAVIKDKDSPITNHDYWCEDFSMATGDQKAERAELFARFLKL